MGRRGGAGSKDSVADAKPHCYKKNGAVAFTKLWQEMACG